MSWSLTVPYGYSYGSTATTTASTFGSDFDTAVADLKKAWADSDYEPTPGVDDQLAAAKVAVQGILDSGAVGSDVPFWVQLSGHANPGHVPAAGYADDTLSVTVNQLTPPPAAAEGTGTT